MIAFGTGGWRAVIGDEFIKSNIQLLAKTLAVKMKNEGKTEQGIIIGYDRRFLSKESMRWLGQVFAAEGIKALFGGSTEVRADKTIKIGGIRGYCVDMGIIADETLDSKLEAQREWFVENAALSVL